MASLGEISDAIAGLAGALKAYQNNKNPVTAAALADATIGLSAAVLSALKDNPLTSAANGTACP